MLSSSQEGERISFPVLEKEEGEARVPFSFEMKCASYFPCMESLHQTWALGQAGC